MRSPEHEDSLSILCSIQSIDRGHNIPHVVLVHSVVFDVLSLTFRPSRVLFNLVESLHVTHS